MKRLIFAGLCLVAVGAVWGEQPEKFLRISPIDAHYFALPDGRTWVPIGCNICFDRLEKPTTEARALFDGWMTKFAANGGNFMRVWLSTPFLEVMPERAGEYSAEATENVKWLVRRAEELNIKLKFTFENFRAVKPKIYDRSPTRGIVSFTRPVYWPYAKSIKEFFQSEECFRIYVDRARHIAEAVGNSPALVAVELWNEFTSTGVDLAISSPWSERMMVEMAKIFPHQMVLQNLGSFSDTNAYQVYDWLAEVKGNAYLQAHRYLDLGAPTDIVRGPMDILCADAIRELRERRMDQPTILAETGAVEPNHTGPSHLYKLDHDGVLIHDEIFAPFFAGSAGSGQPWHWDHQYITGMNLWFQFARFAKAIEGLDPAREHFRPFHAETKRLRVYGLAGTRTTVMWCRDKENDWNREFVEKVRPRPVVGARLPFGSATGYSAYLPFEDRTVSLPAGRLGLPTFTRSCVIRFATH